MTFSTNESIHANGSFNKNEGANNSHFLRDVTSEQRELLIFILEILVLSTIAMILAFFPIQLMWPYVVGLMSMVVYLVWI